MSAFLVALLWLAGAWPAFSQTSPIYAWTNFAGQPGGVGNVDGTGGEARFFEPFGVAVDSAGNVFVADAWNSTIRKVTSAGKVTTLAGRARVFGTNDGTGSAAQFNDPCGVAVDSAGNVFVADLGNHTIRKVTPEGVVTTLAGRAGTSGTGDGTGSAARFNHPCGVAVDSAGNVFVADRDNQTIRKVTPAGVVTTLGAAWFSSPSGVAVDSDGNVFVADTRHHTIRRVSSAGVVTTLAGIAGASGTNDGPSTVARFNNPEGVTVDTNGNVFVADRNSHTIRKVTSAGVVTTLAGLGGSAGSADGTNSAARFDNPDGVAADGAGNVFVADAYNDTIRRVSSAGVVTTLAGRPPASGTNDGIGSAARFYQPEGVAVDSAGNVFVADRRNSTIRKVTPMGVVTTLAGKAGASGTNDGAGSAARFRGPSGMVVDSAGNVFVADSASTIRQLTLVGTNWVVTTLAGKPGTSGTNDGTGSAARFYYPSGVAVDNADNVFVADSSNHTIRKVARVGANWEVTTLAGSAGVSGTNDGTGSAARFNAPYGVAVDSAGNVFVTEYDSHTIRKVTSTGVVTTLAGSAGTPGTNDGTGSAARFNQPDGLALDSAGTLYVADVLNHTIRKVTPVGTNWVVTTIGGVAGIMGGADGLGSLANFAWPQGIAVDSAGTLYVAEYANNRITKGTPLYPWLTAGCDGTHLQLSWPANCLGWELQTQTNWPGAGLGTNWFPLPGSTTNTQMSIPLDPASPSVFYRLHCQ